MVRPIRSYSTSAGVRSHPKERALKEGHSIRLRSGSAGQRPKDKEDGDEEHEPIQVGRIYFLQIRTKLQTLLCLLLIFFLISSSKVIRV